MPESERNELLRDLLKRTHAPGSQVRRELDDAFQHIERHGWCSASFKPGMLSIAAPLIAQDGSLLSINISFPWERGDSWKIVHQYSATLIDLASRVKTTWWQKQ
jgi:DNA-binding IclR family transcriptional regulator